MEIFHLSLPCQNLEETGEFYIDVLGASSGRNKDKWLDINLYGHQITFTQCGDFNFEFPFYRFEKEVLPSFHFGIILNQQAWEALHRKVKELELLATAPTLFLGNQIGEHHSFFVKDPNQFFVEFKTFPESDHIFQY